MTTPFRRRPRAGQRIVDVRNRWRLVGPEQGREVLVRRADGELVVRYLPDEHPALQAFIARAAVAA